MTKDLLVLPMKGKEADTAGSVDLFKVIQPALSTASFSHQSWDTNHMLNHSL